MTTCKATANTTMAALMALSSLVLAKVALAQGQTKTIFSHDDYDLSHAPDHAKIPVVEVDWVQIEESPTEMLLRNPSDYYVEFSHDYPPTIDSLVDYSRTLSGPSYYYVKFSDDYPVGPYVRGYSYPLSKNLVDSWVNLPIGSPEKTNSSQVPLECAIKKKRPFPFPDKTEFKASVNLDDILHSTVTVGSDAVTVPEVTTGLFNKEGKQTRSNIKLRFLINGYVENTEGSKRQKKQWADFYYRVFLWIFHKTYPTFSTTVCMLEKPVQRANPNLETVSILNDTIEFPRYDEFFGGVTGVKKFLAKALEALPATNRNNPVSDRARMRNEIRTKQLLTNVISPFEGHWYSPLSDESMARFFFSGLGMHIIKKEGDGYVADTMVLSKNIAYKKNFKKYGDLGVKVWFDKDAKITQIEHRDGIVTPNQLDWEWAKLKARSAGFVLVSLQHLMDYHLHWANVPAMAIRKFLRPSNPLRQALTPHFFRSHFTSASSEFSLVQKKSTLGRALPFAYEDGYLRILNSITEDYNFEFYPDELKRKGLLDCDSDPENHTLKNSCNDHIGKTDGLPQRDIIGEYISNLFDEIDSEKSLTMDNKEVEDMYKYIAEKLRVPSEFSLENLKKVFTEIIFRVTGMHQSIGNVAIYALEPFMVNFRMEDKTVTGNYESIVAVSVISGRTQPNEYPVISDDWSHVLHNGKSKAYTKFRSDLEGLEELIDERNEHRRFTNKDFHPHVTAIAVTS